MVKNITETSVLTMGNFVLCYISVNLNSPFFQKTYLKHHKFPDIIHSTATNINFYRHRSTNLRSPKKPTHKNKKPQRLATFRLQLSKTSKLLSNHLEILLFVLGEHFRDRDERLYVAVELGDGLELGQVRHAYVVQRCELLGRVGLGGDARLTRLVHGGELVEKDDHALFVF